MKRTEKSIFVKKLTENLESASSIVLVDYSGLNVKAQQDLQKKLKVVNAKMLVVKNTLFKLAGNSAKMPKEVLTDTVLTGPIALVVTEDDPIAPLQVLGKFAEEHKIPQLKVGVIEGNMEDTQNLVRLSKLPSKDVLAGQVVGAIGAPIYGIIGVLEGNLQKLVFILNEHSKSEALVAANNAK